MQFFINNSYVQVKEITSVARANVASGLIVANIVPTGGITSAIAVAVNTVLNGNRDFINAMAAITNLDC